MGRTPFVDLQSMFVTFLLLPSDNKGMLVLSFFFAWSLEFAWCRRCPSGSKRSKTGHLSIGNVVPTHGRSADSNVICGHLKSFVLLRRCLELLYGGKEGGMLDILR